jgi:hypothetical protein
LREVYGMIKNPNNSKLGGNNIERRKVDHRDEGDS